MVLDSRQSVLANLARVREGVARASERGGRDIGSVRLVAVTKSVRARAVGWALVVGGVELTGLMTLPPMPATAEDSRPHFVRLRELLADVASDHPEAVELSMGMSIDYEVAVEEGATMVRIGTAIFGERSPVST